MTPRTQKLVDDLAGYRKKWSGASGSLLHRYTWAKLPLFRHNLDKVDNNPAGRIESGCRSNLGEGLSEILWHSCHRGSPNLETQDLDDVQTKNRTSWVE
jgi:hypothetical protein